MKILASTPRWLTYRHLLIRVSYHSALTQTVADGLRQSINSSLAIERLTLFRWAKIDRSLDVSYQLSRWMYRAYRTILSRNGCEIVENAGKNHSPRSRRHTDNEPARLVRHRRQTWHRWYVIRLLVLMLRWLPIINASDCRYCLFLCLNLVPLKHDKLKYYMLSKL